MPATTTTRHDLGVREHAVRLTPPIAAFVAGFGPIALLAFSRGGYPVEVVAGYGVVLWWLLVVGLATRALPLPRPTALGAGAVVAVVGLAVWAGISLSWSADPERGLTEVCRFVVAAGSLVLGMSVVRTGHARILAGGVLGGLTLVIVAATLTRLQPDLIAQAQQTGDFLNGARRRTSWPLNYWNAIGAAAAVTVPLGLALAVRARSPITSAMAVVPVPLAALCISLTLSRGGIVACVIGIVALLTLVAPRPVALRTLVAPAIASAALLVAAGRPSAIVDAVGGQAQTDAGRPVLLVCIVGAVAVFLVQMGLATADRARWTPQLPRTTRRVAVASLLVAVALGVVVAIAAGAPHRIDKAWQDFKVPHIGQTVDDPTSNDRLASLSGNERYQMWSGAVDAFKSEPLRGIGIGSWESWWSPRRGDTGFVRNAHSEGFEVLAEAGVIGGALFLLFLILPIAGGVRGALSRRAARSDAALAAPAIVAFGLSVMIDWNWQIGAFMVAGCTLMAIPLSRADDGPPTSGVPTGSAMLKRVVGRTASGFAAVAAIAILATALIAPRAVDESRSAAARGDLPAAASEAAAGESAASFATSPALQRALVEERAGRLAAAAIAATRATDRTPKSWQAWFVLARIEAERGRPASAVAAFKRARALNPNSPLLKP